MQTASPVLRQGNLVMRSTNRIFALIGGFALTLAGAFHANAVPINYSFSVTATDGPLSGDTENGTVTYDSSSIVPGGDNDNS
jgi:hypothetical protein